MVAPAVEGIDLFKVAGRSISGWVPSFKMGATSPVKQPFCRQLEERLLLWLDYHPQVVNYARGDIGPQFAATYRPPIPEHAPFAIGYTFENKPHEYLPDVVGMLTNGKPFIAEAGMEDRLTGGMSRLWENMDSFPTRWSGALQVPRQKQNSDFPSRRAVGHA